MPLFSSRRKPLSSSPRKDTPSPVRSASPPPPNRSRGLLSRSSRPTARAEDRSGSTLSESSTGHSRPHDSYDSGGPHRNETDTGRRSRGLFGRRRARSFDRHDLAHDQTLLNARARVADAEAAERGADAALNAARSAIREARDHVKMLEREAVDEGKRAKRKQAEARNVRKTARHLGRHG